MVPVLLSADQPSIVLTDAVQTVLAPQEYLPSDDCRSGDEGLVGHGVGREDLEFFPHAQHDDIVVFTGQVKLAVGPDGR